MEWTREKIELLSHMWERSFTVREMAYWLGGEFTRNAIIGKARRLNLPRRPNPIKGKPLLSAEELKRRDLERQRRYYASNKERIKTRRGHKGSRNVCGFPPAPPAKPLKPALHPTRTCQNIVSGIGRHAVMCSKQALLRSPWCPSCHSVLVLPKKEAA